MSEKIHVREKCSFCGTINELEYQKGKDPMDITCSGCNNTVMLCSVCEGDCDYRRSSIGGSCKHGLVLYKPSDSTPLSKLRLF